MDKKDRRPRAPVFDYSPSLITNNPNLSLTKT